MCEHRHGAAGEQWSYLGDVGPPREGSEEADNRKRADGKVDGEADQNENEARVIPVVLQLCTAQISLKIATNKTEQSVHNSLVIRHKNVAHKEQ